MLCKMAFQTQTERFMIECVVCLRRPRVDYMYLDFMASISFTCVHTIAPALCFLFPSLSVFVFVDKRAYVP
eukprot:m.34431 g.34431  ORF g.34431 m.34431 type:complete len:71 (-) comp9765_c0_seq1:48-260(-)